MKISTLGYCFKQGMKNIRRNLLFSLASIGTIVACLFLFGVFYSIILNLEKEITDIKSTVTISVFFEDGTSDDQISNIGNEIKKIDNVDTMNYITADSAWKGYIEDVFNNDMDYVQSVFGTDNPLEDSSSYEITLKNVGKQEETVEAIKAISGVRKVNSSDTTAASLDAISNIIAYASVGVIGILLLVSLFLISNTITIGISVRKEEIAIMKLIGAKDVFVRAPFLVEGVVIGLIGAIIPTIIIYFMYDAMVLYLNEHFSIVQNMIDFVPVQQVFVGMGPISILLGVGIGFFGSLLTTHKHLKV